MEQSNRAEFDAAFKRLCAGLDVAPTPVRHDAFFDAFRDLGIADWLALVQYALKDRSLAGLTTNQLRESYRRMLTPPSVPLSAPADTPADALERFANLLLLKHIAGRGGLGSVGSLPSAELSAAVAFKRDLVSEWRGFIAEGDELATRAEFARRFGLGLDRIRVACDGA